MEFNEFFIKIQYELESKIDLIITDPPYNVFNDESDYISKINMENVIKYTEHLLKPNGTCAIFCTWQQASIWAEIIKKSQLVLHSALLNIAYIESSLFYYLSIKIKLKINHNFKLK